MSGANSNQATGASDPTYDLVSVLYHALDGAQTYDKYVQDAQQSGDQQLVQFFQKVQSDNRQCAQQAQQLLGQKLGGQSGSQSGGTSAGQNQGSQNQGSQNQGSQGMNQNQSRGQGGSSISQSSGQGSNLAG